MNMTYTISSMDINEKMDLPRGLIVLLVLGIVLAVAMWLGQRKSSDPYSQAASMPAVNQGQVSDDERTAIDMARHESAVENEQ